MEEEYKKIIYSEEFISKFGDWQKAKRIEIAKQAPIIEKESILIIDNENFSEKIEKYENEKNYSQLRLIGGVLGNEIKGTYNGIQIDRRSIKEIGGHDLNNSDHIKSIYFIPDFITKGTLISIEKNEDIITNKNIKEYQYLISGLKLGTIDYTVKSAIAVTNSGERYYDHKLSQIKKGKLLANLSSVTPRGLFSNFPINLNDKRLFQICQVPQLPYLNKSLEPTLEAIKLVLNRKLYLEKDAVTFLYSMCNEEYCNENLLTFRNIYNSQTKDYEPRLTYENVELFFNGLSKNGYISSGFIFDNEFIIINNHGYKKNVKDFFVDIIENQNIFDSTEFESLKMFNSLIKYSNFCKQILYNSCLVCELYKENIDFDHAVFHAKKKFSEEMSNLQNTSAKKELQIMKEKYEYFKRNAIPLYKSAYQDYLLSKSIKDGIEKIKNENERLETENINFRAKIMKLKWENQILKQERDELLKNQKARINPAKSKTKSDNDTRSDN